MTAIPSVEAPTAPRLPKVAERKLRTGLRLLAVRKAGVPRFEARLRIAVGRPRDTGDPGRSRLLAETLLAGTPDHTSVEIARHLQALGAHISVSVDAEQLVISASGLAGSITPTLDLLAQVLTEATYPEGEVALQRQRVSQEITIARSQPQTIAAEAFLARIYPDHPYARMLPDQAALERLTRTAIRGHHRQRLLPRGSVLVLVGDIAPQKMLDVAERAMKAWKAPGTPAPLPAPRVQPSGPITLTNRPGAVQTNIRIGGRAVDRRHPDHPGLTLANTIFGGYFSSRLVENIRERRGYTYSPNSSVVQNLQAAHLTVGADVATEVTAPALVEIAYELGRIASLPVEADELEAARRYLLGGQALAVQTQAGLAGLLSALAAVGLDIDYLRDYPARIGRVTIDDVQAAAATYLAPARLITVLVGDAEKIAGPVQTLGELEVT